MNNQSRFASILGCAAALAMVSCSAGGVAPPAAQGQSSARTLSFSAGWIHKDGIVYHVPHYMVTRQFAIHVKPDIVLTYYGGPVQVTPTVYLIFWNYTKYGDSHGVKSLLESYISSMGGSKHNNIYTQYFEDSGGHTIYITNPSSQYGGAWEDDTDKIPAHPSDSQVAAEALKGVAHFGYNANASYVVATAHGHSTSGFATQWCAYHSATTSGGNLVSYTNLPYMPDGGSSCGANIISPPSDETGADEGVTIVQGHEQGESVTDPNPPYGWYNYQDGEIGDICAWQNIQNDPFGSHSYTMQPMFSNATQSCVHSY